MTTSKKTAGTTPEDGAKIVTPEGVEEIQSAEKQVDIVANVSRRADGTPDQTPGFVVLADPAPQRDEPKKD